MKVKLFNMFNISNEEKIRNWKPLKALLYFSIPTILMALVTPTYSLIDRYISLQYGSRKLVNEYQFVNSLSEAKAVINAATSYANSITGFLEAFVVFISAGISIPFAIAFGKNSKVQMQKILANGFVISLIICFVVSLCFYFITDPYVRFQAKIKCDLFDNKTQQQTFDLMINLAIRYDQIYASGFTLLLFSNLLSAVLRNEGKIFIVSFINISAVFINILMSWLLAEIVNLGMIGTVWATVITWAFVSFVLFIIIVCLSNNHVRFSLNDLKLDWQIVKQIFTTGIVQFVLTTTKAVLGFVNTRLDTLVSEIEMTNNTSSSKIPVVVQVRSAMVPWLGFLKAPNNGIVQAATLLMAYAYGSKMYKRFWDVIKNTFWIISLFYVIVFIIVLTSGNYMLMIFTVANLDKYRWAFVMIVAGYLFIPLISTSLVALQIMQKNLIAFLCALIRPILAMMLSILGWVVAKQTCEPLWYFAFSAAIGLATSIVHIPLVLRVWGENKYLVREQQNVIEIK